MKETEILNELCAHGICVVHNYWSKALCTEALREISELDQSHFSIGQGGDRRCGTADQLLPTARDFKRDSFIQSIANSYSSCNDARRTQLGIVTHSPSKEIDSGGGWHVDSQGSPQFKSFIYLSDVTATNGPFTIIKASKEKAKNLPTYSNLRIEEDIINQELSSHDIYEITGEAGTCILADTTNIHRGKQISEGMRYTYTTYFYN